MNSPFNRRGFFKASLQAAVACAGIGSFGAGRLRAIEPFRRAGPPRFKTSLVAYSLRKYLTAANPAERITLFDVIDYAAAQGFNGVELTGYYFQKPATPEYLIALKRHAYLRGITVSGTSFNNNLDAPAGPKLDQQIAEVKAWIDRAAILGAPYVRIIARSGPGLPTPGSTPSCLAAIEECAAYGGTKGVFIGQENDRNTPAEILEIVHKVRNPWYALNLDLGNFETEDVYGDLAQCAPYAINVHYKIDIQEAGKPEEPADIPRMIRILSDVNYHGFLAFEYEAANDPYGTIPGWLQRTKAYLASIGEA